MCGFFWAAGKDDNLGALTVPSAGELRALNRKKTAKTIAIISNANNLRRLKRRFWFGRLTRIGSDYNTYALAGTEDDKEDKQTALKGAAEGILRR
jgi:hypothetical protein